MTQKKTKSRRYVVLTSLVVLLGIALTVVIVFAFIYRKPAAPQGGITDEPTLENQSGEKSEEAAPEPDGIPSEIDTSDWKTYIDPALKFSIKYPPDWTFLGAYRPNHIWFGPAFLPERSKIVEGIGNTFVSIIDISFDPAVFHNPERTIKNLENNGAEIYQLNDYVVRRRSTPGRTVAYVEYRNREGETRMFGVYFSEAYKNLFDGKALIDAMLATFEFIDAE